VFAVGNVNALFAEQLAIDAANLPLCDIPFILVRDIISLMYLVSRDSITAFEFNGIDITCMRIDSVKFGWNKKLCGKKRQGSLR